MVVEYDTTVEYRPVDVPTWTLRLSAEELRDLTAALCLTKRADGGLDKLFQELYTQLDSHGIEPGYIGLREHLL